MLNANNLPTTAAMQTAWLDGSQEECTAIANALAEQLGCNRNTLYTMLTNLHVIVTLTADVNGDI